MSEKLSASAVLGILSERVRRIESQSASVAAVLEKMVADIESRKAVTAPGSAPPPALGTS